MKKLIKTGSCFLLMLFLLCSVNLVAYAETGEGNDNEAASQSSEEEGSLNVNVGVIGDNPDVSVSIEGDNPNVNIGTNGENPEIYVNGTNINTPTVVNEYHSHSNSYTTVVEGVSLSEVDSEINKSLSPLSARTGEVEKNLNLAIDGLAKVIQMIGDPNQLDSNVVSTLNGISGDLSGIKTEITSIKENIGKAIFYLEELVKASSKDSLKNDVALDKEIAKVWKEISGISKWLDSFAGEVEANRAISDSADKVLDGKISAVQEDIKKILEALEELKKSIKSAEEKDAELSAQISSMEKSFNEKLAKEETRIGKLEGERDILIAALIAAAAIIIIIFILLIKALAKLRKKIV